MTFLRIEACGRIARVFARLLPARAVVEKAHEKYEDFDEVVGELKPTSPWSNALMRSENGEDIAYYLGKDKAKEGRRIAALDPVSQILEIGRISAKLELQPQERKTPSEAPAPIKPVGGSNAPSSKKLTDMTQDEFEKKRRAQIAARR